MRKDYELKKELKRLASIHGSGTELISIYIPPDFYIADEIAKLREEHGQASNIKSKATKLNVQGALDKLMQYVKLYKQPPKNGIAIFCGNISKEQAKPDIELFSIEPPMPLQSNIYRCDSTFLIEPLQAMLESTDSYALLVMDGREATLALLRGTAVTVEKKVHSFAHAKVRKGGQSANRYARAIEESIDDYYKSVAGAVNEMYAKHNFKLKGLIVGGPGPAKENFLRAKHLNYQVKVLGTFDTGYTDETEGIRELMEKSREMLAEHETAKEAEAMERFMNAVARNGAAVFGYQNVAKALAANNVARLLVSDEIDIAEVKYKCTQCGAEITRIENGTERTAKHDCGGNLSILEQRDPVEGLIDDASNKGVEIVFISQTSRYGKELLLGFGGIAAMLKYR